MALAADSHPTSAINIRDIVAVEVKRGAHNDICVGDTPIPYSFEPVGLWISTTIKHHFNTALMAAEEPSFEALGSGMMLREPRVSNPMVERFACVDAEEMITSTKYLVLE